MWSMRLVCKVPPWGQRAEHGPALAGVWMLRLSCSPLALSQCHHGLALAKPHIWGVQHRGLAGASVLTAIPVQDLSPGSCPLASLTSARLLLVPSICSPGFATWLHRSLCTAGPFPEEHASHAALTLPPKLSPRLSTHKP